MSNIMTKGRDHWSGLSRISLYHKLGNCPVGETSVIIAVSSPHRAEALAACSWIIDEVKKKAQIFKREYYEGVPDSEAVWKQN